MPRLIEEVPGTRFLVAGSGTHEAELHKQAEELGLMEHGTFLGWIGDDVLHSLYRIADLTVVPSIYEPFGLVALEAMASGCPCIVADTGGLREVVPHEEAGLRFRAHDPEALAEVAIRVLSDDELRPPPGRRSLRAPAALRLGRRRRADRRASTPTGRRAEPRLSGGSASPPPSDAPRERKRPSWVPPGAPLSPTSGSPGGSERAGELGPGCRTRATGSPRSSGPPAVRCSERAPPPFLGGPQRSRQPARSRPNSRRAHRRISAS